MDKGFIKERDMVHQVLRERSIMSSIVTSNARYRTTLVSISYTDLSLFFHTLTLSLYHSAYSFMSTSTCFNIHDLNSPSQTILLHIISPLYTTAYKYSNFFHLCFLCCKDQWNVRTYVQCIPVKTEPLYSHGVRPRRGLPQHAHYHDQVPLPSIRV